MALEMRDRCQRCDAPLTADGTVFICSYECTFCPTCTAAMNHICPQLRRRTDTPPPPQRQRVLMPESSQEAMSLTRSMRVRSSIGEGSKP